MKYYEGKRKIFQLQGLYIINEQKWQAKCNIKSWADYSAQLFMYLLFCFMLPPESESISRTGRKNYCNHSDPYGAVACLLSRGFCYKGLVNRAGRRHFVLNNLSNRCSCRET